MGFNSGFKGLIGDSDVEGAVIKWFVTEGTYSCPPVV